MMNTTSNARKHRSAVISKLLSEITPQEQRQTSIKMTVAARINELIEGKGLSKKDLADKLQKNPSEITKWLSGTHNFTVDTLAAISIVLDTPVQDFFMDLKVKGVHEKYRLLSNVPAMITPEENWEAESGIGYPVDDSQQFLTGSAELKSTGIACGWTNVQPSHGAGQVTFGNVCFLENRQLPSLSYEQDMYSSIKKFLPGMKQSTK